MLVGFTGRKRHGKDTAGMALQLLGYSHLSMAHPMKEIAEYTLRRLGLSYDMIRYYVHGDGKQEHIPELKCTMRHYLQTLGTEFGRVAINENLWVDILNQDVSLEPDNDFYVTDIRFQNEADAIRSQGGIVIRIINPSVPMDEFSNHPSEQEIDSMVVDGEIQNIGSIEELHRKVSNLVADIREIKGL